MTQQMSMQHGNNEDEAAASAPAMRHAEAPSDLAPEVTPRPRQSKPRKPASFAPPRTLPWDSGLTRTWPGTLILSWTVLTTILLVKPTWITVGALAALLAIATLIIRVPASALPRPPIWFWSGLIGGFVGATLGGGFFIFLRAMAVTIVVLWGTGILLWTYTTDRLVQAMATLLRPLKWLHVPVDEWTRIMQLALRALPILQDQTTSVIDTVKIRMGRSIATLNIRGTLRLLVDISTATLSAASRGAADTGRAMSLRGGLPEVRAERLSVSWRDGLVAIASCVAAAVALVWG
ncbi:energy-coupling factor transporter transmembrane protein EcfT [Schaalia sp. ZJ1691]|uniref:energy-coupling factor transporter transmembrane component T n=1 Tax=Schaalia sp. ZJ1691 TaxID=2709404 RepID=UPI001F14B963|nr:energy-coupling factor transporter transmembrane protein EcfT [Schaalia sp. ZJ1691]